MVRVCLLLLTFLLQNQSKPLPEAKSFLEEFRKTLQRDQELLSQYTFTEIETHIELDSKQQPKKTETKVYQVFPGHEGMPTYRRLISKDGVPLKEKEIEKQDKEHNERVQKAKKQNRADTRMRDDKTVKELFDLFDIQLVRRELIEGRPGILVTFQPRPKYKPRTREGKILHHLAGRAWISEEDHQLMKLEAEVITPISLGMGMLAKLQKGARLSTERRKINNEVWLPVRSETTLSARVLLLKGLHFREITEYSDHKKYSVETILKFPTEKREP